MLVPTEPSESAPPALQEAVVEHDRYRGEPHVEQLLSEDPQATVAALEQGQQAVSKARATEGMRAYPGHFEKLLWTEEIQLRLDLASFDLVEKKPTTRRIGGEYVLQVRGARAEKRPSVLRGDTVWVKLPDGSGKRWQGKAVDIRREEVALRFHCSSRKRTSTECALKCDSSLGVGRCVSSTRASPKRLPESILFREPQHLREPPASSERITDADRESASATTSSAF